MRIGLIYHQFRKGAGGLERYLNGLAEHLAQDGHELALIGVEFDPAFSEIPNSETHKVACGGPKRVRMRQFAERSGECAKRLGLDVTIGFGRTYDHDLHRAGGGCHRVYSRYLPIHKRVRAKNRLELEIERRLYQGGGTRHFVVNSGLVGEQLIGEYGVSKDAISVIHTPVDSVRFRPADDRLATKKRVCEEFGTDPERPAFLFVSLSHRRKGLQSLLDVWPEVDADLWIAGKPLKGGFRRQIAKAGLAGKVRFLGETADLVPLYQAADGFLHPTLYDACANTVLQSLACGLPGLISSRDGASEFIRDGENGFLLNDPTDCGQVLEGVRKLANLGSLAETVRASARKTALPLTWETHLQAWLQVIADLRK